jgi:uncharacterized membrane protein
MRESVPSGVRMPVIRAAFAVASIAWAATIPLAALLAARAHASVPATALVAAVYVMGSVICHQLPDRSFHLWGAQLPVCARCAGIYAGAAIAVGVLSVGHRFSSALRGVRGATGDAALARRVFILAALPAAATLAYEWITAHVPGNPIRAVSGLPIGVAVAWLVLDATRREAAADNQVN